MNNIYKNLDKCRKNNFVFCFLIYLCVGEATTTGGWQSDGHEDMQRHVRYGHVPHTVYTLKIKKIKNSEISMMMKLIKRSIKKINK